MKNKKQILMTICLMLVVCIASVGGTIAWLTDKTETITNTFTESDIDIELNETIPTNKTAKMVPGEVIGKDPKVTIKANSEACWVFVKVEEINNVDGFLTYAIAEGWTALPGVDGVYYREQAATTADVTYSVLAGDKVTVKTDVTKAMMDGLTTANYPKLQFTAYAIQKASFGTAAAAWAEITTPTV